MANVATGLHSTVPGGEHNQASGTDSTAFGGYNNAQGLDSLAGGDSNTAYGEQSVALGEDNSAEGNRSVALGENASVPSGDDNSFVWSDGTQGTGSSNFAATGAQQFDALATNGFTFQTGLQADQ